MFLHELPDAKELFLVVSEEKAINPSIVEKDYWVMHTLWGLQQQGFDFELKGGTSLSKGFDIINRFSEDIDIQIHPAPSLEVKSGKNHDKKKHIDSRRAFFDNLADILAIQNIVFHRDHEFDAMAVLDARLGTHPEFVFSYKNNPIQQCNTRAWTNALNRAGIENFRWHDLRHTWASWHVQNGTSLLELQQLGGWSSFEMVLRYAHLSGDHLRQAANRISSMGVTANFGEGARL